MRLKSSGCSTRRWTSSVTCRRIGIGRLRGSDTLHPPSREIRIVASHLAPLALPEDAKEIESLLRHEDPKISESACAGLLGAHRRRGIPPALASALWQPCVELFSSQTTKPSSLSSPAMLLVALDAEKAIPVLTLRGSLQPDHPALTSTLPN